MKQNSAAIITVKNACDMTKKGRKNIADWMRKEAEFLEIEGKVYSRRFTARYLYGCKTAFILFFSFLLAGCSMGSVGSSLVRDVTSAAPAFCSAADPASVKQAQTVVFSQIPAGSDKDKAQQAVEAASFSVEATCNVIKAIEASRASQAAQPVK